MRALLRPLVMAAALGALAGLGGCAVVMVAGAVASVAATGAGIAADVAVGTVRMTGKAVGAAVDAVKPGEVPAR